MIELQKGIPLIDQHDEHGYWGGKFGGSQIAESLNYPIAVSYTHLTLPTNREV